MPIPQIIPLPPFFEMADGMRIVVTAVNATTNAVVSGVVVSGVSIDVDPGEAGAGPAAKPVDYTPAFTYGLQV